MNKKIGRNDKCPCASGKKYKMCCQKNDEKIKNESINKLENGHPISSNNVKDCYGCLLELYKYYKIIDISNYLSNATYEVYQKKHYYNKVIMIAERNNTNDEVFKTRGPETVNIMVMFSGSYKCFNYSDLSVALEYVIEMIEKRKQER